MSLWEKIKSIFSKNKQALLNEGSPNPSVSERNEKTKLGDKYKFSKEDLIKPENLTSENWISNALIYLGVDFETANNHVVMKEVEKYFIENYPTHYDLHNFKEAFLDKISGMFGKGQIEFNGPGTNLQIYRNENEINVEKSSAFNLDKDSFVTHKDRKKYIDNVLMEYEKNYGHYTQNTGFTNETTKIIRNSNNPFKYKIQKNNKPFQECFFDNEYDVLHLEGNPGIERSNEELIEMQKQIESRNSDESKSFCKYCEKVMPEISEQGKDNSFVK